MDFVRRQVAEGKELSEICENICGHCLAPDTSSGAGIGCDNMTVMVIAILHGRTQEEWYQWIADRVNNNYGYNTPASPPQIYAQSRLMSFRARREALERRQRSSDDEESPGFLDKGSSFARTLAADGIQFSHSRISTNDFAPNDDSDDYESGEEDDLPGTFYGRGAQFDEAPDPTKDIKAQLDALERDIREEDGTNDDGVKTDGILENEQISSQHLPAKLLPNGGSSSPVEQLKSQPHGDEPLPVVKAEGLIDSSEDPLLSA